MLEFGLMFDYAYKQVVLFLVSLFIMIGLKFD